MKIGEFAKVCDTRISVLRHYDKEKLLIPVYIDRFTGYRYYSKEQIPVFFRITALKQAGFSLSEIKGMIERVDNDAKIIELFDQKEAEIIEMLHNLKSAKKMMIGANVMIHVVFNETEKGTFAKCGKINSTYEQMDNEIAAGDYQRVSAIMLKENPDNKEQELVCEVVKLNKELVPLKENIQLPFENDEAVIGKWEVIGEYVVKDEFYEDRECRNNWFYEYPSGIYFLPNGEDYWCYSWTKGKLLIDTGDSSSVNQYEIEEIDGERYMFVTLKSYHYRRGGKPKILVLKQVDQNRYSAKELARKDNIDMPFVDDKRVIGKWKSFDFIATKEDFSSEGSGEPPIFFKEIEFFEGGSCTSVYGEEIISGDDKQVWTKGFVLRKWNSCACAYEIRTVDDRDYLIIEWKSGDYRWGGFDTDYYVFVRA